MRAAVAVIRVLQPLGCEIMKSMRVIVYVSVQIARHNVPLHDDCMCVRNDKTFGKLIYATFHCKVLAGWRKKTLFKRSFSSQCEAKSVEQTVEKGALGIALPFTNDDINDITYMRFVPAWLVYGLNGMYGKIYPIRPRSMTAHSVVFLSFQMNNVLYNHGHFAVLSFNSVNVRILLSLQRRPNKRKLGRKSHRKENSKFCKLRFSVKWKYY